jgi:glycine/D-amino acid oxidase-like deaminating enzyme
VDVVIIGAGIVGAACARALARAGVGVAVLDKGQPGAETSAHGEGNLLVSDKGPGPELDMALVSLRRWAELAAELAEELGPRFPGLEFERKGGIVAVASQDGAARLGEFARAGRGAGVDAVNLSEDRWRELEPDLADGIVAAVHYPQDAQLHPVIATQALLASARRAGATIHPGVEVTGPLGGRGGRLGGVRTTAGDVSAAGVVLAAGPWSGEVGRRLGVDLPVSPRRGMVLVTMPMPRRVRHKVYDGDYVAATQSAAAGLRVSAVVESTRAGTVLIGSSREQVGFDAGLRPMVLAEIARRAISLFPFLAEVGLMRAYLGFRPFVPDHLPVIGSFDRLPGLWCATGHEGAGIGLAPATGDLVAELMVGAGLPDRPSAAGSSIDPTPFSPERPSLSAAAAATTTAARPPSPARARPPHIGPGSGPRAPASPRRGGDIVIRFEGEAVRGRAGQTVAGILLGGGYRAWRTARSGAPRGVLCGIGVCFDCLVTVNGDRDIRACQRRAHDGDAVSRNPAAVTS